MGTIGTIGNDVWDERERRKVAKLVGVKIDPSLRARSLHGFWGSTVGDRFRQCQCYALQEMVVLKCYYITLYRETTTGGWHIIPSVAQLWCGFITIIPSSRWGRYRSLNWSPREFLTMGESGGHSSNFWVCCTYHTKPIGWWVVVDSQWIWDFDV